jgi:hypothetical protein
MSEFTLNIELGNEAMQTGLDVAEALKKVAKKIYMFGGEDELIGCGGKIMDGNGNSVGSWQVSDD